MSGLPRKYPGVWQSWQLAMVTRYLPRAMAAGSAAAAADAAKDNGRGGGACDAMCHWILPTSSIPRDSVS